MLPTNTESKDRSGGEVAAGFTEADRAIDAIFADPMDKLPTAPADATAAPRPSQDTVEKPKSSKKKSSKKNVTKKRTATKKNSKKKAGKRKTRKKTVSRKGTSNKRAPRTKSATQEAENSIRSSQPTDETSPIEPVTVADVILEREFSTGPRSGGPGVVLLGLDLGTRRTALAASRGGRPMDIAGDMFPTVVGSPKPGVAVKGGVRCVFGRDALELREHVRCTFPVREGVIHDVELCRRLIGHLRQLVDPRTRETVWSVVSAPADSTPEQRRTIRQVMLGMFEKTFIVPEPYLAALGMCRDPSVETTGITVARALRTLVVDVGDQSTRLCRIDGKFPDKHDQIRVERGGRFVDEQVLAAAQVHANLKLTPELVRSFKEEQGIEVSSPGVEVGNTGPHTEILALVTLIRDACEQLLLAIVEGIDELLERRGLDSLADAAQSIVLTGRSSRIPNLNLRLEKLLEERFDTPISVLVPADHQRLVVRGALHVAEALGEREWETAEAEQRREQGDLSDWSPRAARGTVEAEVHELAEEWLSVP